MNDLKKSFENANKLFLPLLKTHPVELLGIFLFCDLFDQYFKILGEVVAVQGGVNWAAMAGRMTVSLLLMVLLTHWFPLRLLQRSGSLPTHLTLLQFVKTHIKPFSLESLRALGMVLLFLLLLILPGLWKYVQYILVPYVVLADPEYQKGNVDALQESARLMKGYALLGMALMIISIPIFLFFGQLTEPILVTKTPLYWLLAFGVGSLLSFYLNLLLFEFYRVRKTSLGGPHGTHV